MEKGKNVTIADFVVIKEGIDVTLGDNVRISEFTRISSACSIGDHVEIASHCSIAGGGGKIMFTMKGYASLAAGVKIWLSSNDYKNGLVTHSVPGVEEIEGPVTMEKYTGIGSNSVIMPNNHIPEGTVIGALSFVPPNFKFDPWSIYAGCPVRKVGTRDKEQILKPLKNK